MQALQLTEWQPEPELREETAPLTDAGLTPCHAIRRSLPVLTAGSSAVVVGAGGGPGHLAVQILRAVSPARVVAVDGWAVVVHEA